MNHKPIPRKYRKEAIKLIEEFEQRIYRNDETFTSWNEFLQWNQTGAMDGWLMYTDKKYKALQWLRQITAMVNKLNFYGEDEDREESK